MLYSPAVGAEEYAGTFSITVRFTAQRMAKELEGRNICSPFWGGGEPCCSHM
jgi:hypothetical protein